jgi:hypothetical protein
LRCSNHDRRYTPLDVDGIWVPEDVMPWPANADFYNFNEFSILLNAAPQYGVYAIFNWKKDALLVGAGEVLADLVRIVESTDEQLCGLNPEFFSFVQAEFTEANKLKRQLVAELNPPCNEIAIAHAAGM